MTKEDEKKYYGAVVWYNQRRGTGVVDIGGNERDIFVHLRTLRNFGIYHLTEGQEILLHATDEGKGLQAKKVKVFATNQTGMHGIIHRLETGNMVKPKSLPYQGI